ncbi:MAG: hypothetical protein EHM93_17185 [Bacteroidales bacterium]|nr:MAG: hypothetical protein EHM93_17185 [Bacteroidales bacterium]
MKRFLHLVFLIFIINYSNYEVYSQEEFFGKHNGLSLAYLKGFDAKVQAVGVSCFLKKGINLGLGLEKVNSRNYTSVSILRCPDWGVDSSLYKVALGPSYSYLSNHHIIALNICIIRCFFVKSECPFSLNVSFSPQWHLIKDQPLLQSSSYNDEKYRTVFSPIIGFGYTQILGKGNFYPFIGLSLAYDITSKANLFSGAIGMNLRL